VLKAVVSFGLTHRAIILMGLFVFVAGGVAAFSRLNIEAYPNPAPVILEITAQAPGLSAEEMERYYTIPMEVGLYPTPGVANIRSTSFYGLSFVRVTFQWGIDYYFAYTQAALSLQQRVSLPNGVSPTIQQSSKLGRDLSQTLQHLEAGHNRHADIAQYEVWPVSQDRDQALLTAVSDADFEPPIDQLFGN
jgi:cobalt-zinc-cadmium resistance protein CzcA